MRFLGVIYAQVSFLVLVGCSALSLDRSADAFKSGDFTLVNACQSAPSAGFDSCHFTVGDKITSSWHLVTVPPIKAKNVTGGSVDVYYQDVHRVYPIQTWMTDVPFADLFGTAVWSAKEDEVMVEALATINWVDNAGIKQITKYRGVALILVTDPGYERLAIDSGNAAWGAECSVQYSTTGRSVIQCQ